jgi:MFS family permease
MPGGRVLAAAAVAAGLTPLNSTMIAVALPSISVDFGVAPATVTVWVVTAYLVATIACQLPAGTVADRLGYARTLTLGRWMFAAGATAACLAPSIALVIGGRLLMAAGGALMVPTAMALLRVAVPAERRPRAFGAMGAVMGGAAALGPAFGGLVIAQMSWRVLFLVNIPLTLLSWLLQPRALDVATAARADRRTHWFASLTNILTTPAFAAGASVIALQNFAMYALLIQVPFFFSGDGRGSSLGLAMMAMTATMAVTSPIGGRLAERVGATLMVAAGGIAGAAGIAGLVNLAPDAPAVQIGARLLLVGLGLGLSTGPSQAASLSAIDAARSGMAAATLSTRRYLGAIAGTAVLGVTMGGGDDVGRHQLALWIFAGAFAVTAASGIGLGGRSKIVVRQS